MKTIRAGALALLSLAALAAAARAGDAKGEIAGELANLRKEYEAARTAWYAQKPVDPAKNPDLEFVPRGLALARRAKGTDDGVRAAAFVVQHGANAQGEIKKAAQEALELALGAGLDRPALAEMAVWIRFGAWGLGEEKAVALLRTMAEKAGAPDARAAGLLNLAIHRNDGAEVGEKERTEALAMLHRVLAEHAKSPSAKEAAGYVFELEHLQVGMTAPDFEAVDGDGAKFRLSDYRGTVVLLDFWGFW